MTAPPVTAPAGAAPGITVVIPAFDAAAFLAETIRSARNQAAELLVVDDGSSDGTAAVAEAEGARLLRQPNGGVSRARNAGLHAVASPFVCFLDADDRLRPGALARLHARLSDHPEAPGAFGAVAYIGPEGAPIPARPRTPPARVGLRAVLAANFIDTPGAVLLRTDAVRAAGGFRPGLAVAEEWELWTRLARHGPFLSVPGTVIDYRLHPASAMRRTATGLAAFEPALQVAFADPARFPFPPATLRRLERRKRAGIHRTLAATGPAFPHLRALLALALRSGLDPAVLETLARTAARACRRRVAPAATPG